MRQYMHMHKSDNLTAAVSAIDLQIALNLDRERERHLAGAIARTEAGRQRRAKLRALNLRAARAVKQAGFSFDAVR